MCSFMFVFLWAVQSIADLQGQVHLTVMAVLDQR